MNPTSRENAGTLAGVLAAASIDRVRYIQWSTPR
jgi:hypothetical protein